MTLTSSPGLQRRSPWGAGPLEPCPEGTSTKANEPVVVVDPRGVGCHVTQDHVCSPTRKQLLDFPEGSRVSHISRAQKRCSFQREYVGEDLPQAQSQQELLGSKEEMVEVLTH